MNEKTSNKKQEEDNYTASRRTYMQTLGAGLAAYTTAILGKSSAQENNDYNQLENNTQFRSSDELTIKEEGSYLEDYANQNDVIDTSGLQEGIDDWLDGEIETNQLQEVINYWLSKEEIE
jgi:cell division protein FtsI/penicillin-binding protein 2